MYRGFGKPRYHSCLYRFCIEFVYSLATQIICIAHCDTIAIQMHVYTHCDAIAMHFCSLRYNCDTNLFVTHTAINLRCNCCSLRYHCDTIATQMHVYAHCDTFAMHYCSLRYNRDTIAIHIDIQLRYNCILRPLRYIFDALLLTAIQLRYRYIFYAHCDTFSMHCC